MRNLDAVVIKAISVVLGVAVAACAAFFLIFPILDLFTCDSFWEQGCGPHHELQLLGSLAAAGLGGLLAGWAAAVLFGKAVEKLQGR